MKKKVFMLLGNGFTIDLLTFLDKKNQIDVTNLFKEGDKVPWPSDNEVGFLSYKYTPHLWEIGANVSVSSLEAIELIENIITTANMFTEIKRNRNNIEPIALNRIKQSRYIKAYRELTSYLKHLFIYYNGKVADSCITEEALSDWGWSKYIKNLYNNSDIEDIIIVTYNYDIFLERVLAACNINFSISGIEAENEKIKIIKPHGSISFTHKTELPQANYRINYEQILPEADISDFIIKYDDLNKNYLVDAIIPPAGNSTRINVNWANDLRKLAVENAKTLTFKDELVISGLSYWHVDRQEIDELLANIHPSINAKMLNPRIPKTFNAIIQSIFENYIAYSNSEILGGGIR